MKYTIVGRVVNDTFTPSDEQRTVGYVLSNEQGVCRAFTLSQVYEFYKKGELTAPINSFTNMGIDFKGIDNSLLPKYSEQYVSFAARTFVVDTRKGVMVAVVYTNRQGLGFEKLSLEKFFRYDTASVIANIRSGKVCLVNAIINKGVIEQSTTRVIVSYDGESYIVIEAGCYRTSLSAKAIIASMKKGDIYFNAYLKNDTIVLKHEVPHVATPVQVVTAVKKPKKPITFINEFGMKDVKSFIEDYMNRFKGKDSAKAIDTTAMFNGHNMMKGSYKVNVLNSKFKGKDGAKVIDTITMFNGYKTMRSKYKGNVLNGKPNGEGIKLYVNGDYYEGEWKNGVFDGKGKLVCPSTRMVYEGEWKNGVPHGHGNFFYAGNFSMTIFNMTSIPKEFDCMRYNGEFVNGKRHGKGTMYFIPQYPTGYDYCADADDGHCDDLYYAEEFDEYDETAISFEGKWENDEMVHGIFDIALLNNMFGDWKNGHIYGDVMCHEELDDHIWSSSTRNYETERYFGCNFIGHIDNNFEIDRGILIDEPMSDIAIPFLKVYAAEDEYNLITIYSLQCIAENMYQGDIFYTNKGHISCESDYFCGKDLDNDRVYYHYAIDFSKVLSDSYAIYRGNLNTSLKPHGKGVLMFRQGYYIGEFENGKINGKGTVYLNNLICVDSESYPRAAYQWSPYTVTDNFDNVTGNYEIKFNGLGAFEKFGLSTVAKIEGIWEIHDGNDKVWGISPILKEGKLTLLSDGSEYEDGVILKIDPKFSDEKHESSLVPANEGILFLRGKKGMTYNSDTSDCQTLLRCLIEMVSKSFDPYHKRKYGTKEAIDDFIQFYLAKWVDADANDEAHRF